MKVSICKTAVYYYETEIPDELCEVDENGRLENEDDFMYACYKADPNYLSDAEEWDSYINSVWSADGKELYVS